MLVIALGLAIVVTVFTLDAAIRANGSGGWFAYAPNTGVVFPGDSGYVTPGSSTEIARSGAMWLGGVAGWAAVSCWILRRRDNDDSKD